MKLNKTISLLAVASSLALPLVAQAADHDWKKDKDKEAKFARQHSNNSWRSANGWNGHGAPPAGYQNRRDDRCDDRDDRYERNDDRYDNRYDGRYDQGSWRQQPGYNNSRYDNRYGNPYGSSSQNDRRQQTKNEWRNIAYAAGAAAVLGYLEKDNTLMFGGAAGALYALWRYEQDRKSQNSIDRTRSRYFDNDYFTRDGQRFERRTVTRDGQKYYQFVRSN